MKILIQNLLIVVNTNKLKIDLLTLVNGPGILYIVGTKCP